MIERWMMAALAVLPLASCADVDPPVPPPVMPLAASQSPDKAGAPGTDENFKPLPQVPVMPQPWTPMSRPAPEGYSAGPAVTPGQFAPPPSPGPITGYGPGGMALPPGAPPNPPYPPGGLMRSP